MTTLSGFVARETEAAVAFISMKNPGKPLWIPRKKISRLTERDDFSKSVQLEGERIRRLAYPVEIEVDAVWMERVGV